MNLLQVTLACVIVQIGFGAYPNVIRWFADQDEFNFTVFSAYRDSLATPLLLGLAAWLEGGGKLIKPYTISDAGGFLLLGAVGIGLQQIFVLLGLYYTLPVVTSLFQQAIPIWGFAIAVLCRLEPVPNPRERIGMMKVSGVLLAVFGALVMNLAGAKASGTTSDQKDPLLGCIFLLLNTLLVGIYMSFQKLLIFRESHEGQLERMQHWAAFPVHVTAFSYAGGAFTCVVVTLFAYGFKLSSLQFGLEEATRSFLLPRSIFWPLLFAIFVPSILCYVLLTFANKHAESSVVTAFWPLQVPISVVCSKLMGFGSITNLQLVGGLFIVSGLLVLSRGIHLAHTEKRSVYETITET